MTTGKILSLALFAATVLYVLLALYGWQKRKTLGVMPFIGLMLAMGWWSLGYGFEIETSTLANKILWAKLQYPGIIAIPVFWLEFAVEYTQREAFLIKRNQVMLWIVPLVTMALVWTNERHHWIWVDTGLEQINGLVVLHLEHGSFFWLSAIYNYVLILMGSWLLVLGIWRTVYLYRAQSILLLFAILLPTVGNIIYLTGLLPNLGVDLTIFLFIPTSLVLAWGIVRYRLLTIIPPAQAAILQDLQDGILVLDDHNQVIYMNRTVEKLLSRTMESSLGKPVDEVCPTNEANISTLLDAEERFLECSLKFENQNHQFEVRITPNHILEQSIPSKRSTHVIVFHDITRRKAVEAALLRREAILKAVNVAAELFLKMPIWEENVPTVLARLGQATSASRVYIFERHDLDSEPPRISQRYEWVDPKTTPQIGNPSLQNISLREIGYTRWEEAFLQHRFIFGLVREFPEAERVILFTQGIQSLAVVPIFIEDKWWGFIGFDECYYERTWEGAELDALRTAAETFGAALGQSYIRDRLLKRQQTLDLLQKILQATLSQSDLHEMSQFLVDHLGNLIGADGCFLTLWNDDKKQVIPFAAYGEFRYLYPSMKPQPGERSFTASVLKAEQTLIVDNAMDSAYVSQRIAGQFPTVSALVLPMISNGRKLGAVLLGFNHPHSFSQEEIVVSEQATNLVSLAVAKFQALEQARRHAEESETLRKAGATVAETLDMGEATSRILHQLANVLPYDSASVQLLRDGELEIIGEEGFKTPVTGMRFPIPGNNPNTVVIESRRPHLLHNVNEIYTAFRQSPHDHIRSWLGVPLIVRDIIIGLLAIDSQESYHFTPSDIELTSAFADQVAVAIENARLFDEVQRLAITDGLTGLLNRRHFLELAHKEFERAQRYARPLSMMIFDVDHFKMINDTYGHPIGDVTLRAIADLCREKIREVDPLGRYGGEEFIGLFVETDLSIAQKVAERLRQEVEKMHVEEEGRVLQVTISIGLAGKNPGTPDLATLINRADQALYVAKYHGRNRVAVSE